MSIHTSTNSLDLTKNSISTPFSVGTPGELFNTSTQTSSGPITSTPATSNTGVLGFIPEKLFEKAEPISNFVAKKVVEPAIDLSKEIFGAYKKSYEERGQGIPLKETYAVLDEMDETSKIAVKNFVFNRIPRAALNWIQLSLENQPIEPILKIDKRNKAKVVDFLQGAIDGLEEKESKTISELNFDMSKPVVTDPNRFVYNLYSGGASMALGIGVGVVTKNPTAAAIVLSSIESSDTYQKAKDNGKTPREAAAITMIEGAGTAYLEKLGFESMFRNVSGGRLYSASVKSVTESLQESAQTIWQNTVEKFGYNKAKRIFDGVGETFVSTIPLGFLSGGSIDFIKENTNLIDDISNDTGLTNGEVSDLVMKIKSGVEYDMTKLKDDERGQIKPKQLIEETRSETTEQTASRIKSNGGTFEEFVMAQGETFYHGGTIDLSRAEITQRAKGNQLPYGIHFIKDTKLAGEFATGETKLSPQKGIVQSAILDIKNPFNVSGRGIYKEGTLEFKILKEIADKSGLKDIVKPYDDEVGSFVGRTEYVGGKLGKPPEGTTPAIAPYVVLDNAKLSVVQKVLKDNGYDQAIKYSMKGSLDPLGGGPPVFNDAWAILDKNLIKTKSQLEQIWNQAQEEKPTQQQKYVYNINLNKIDISDDARKVLTDNVEKIKPELEKVRGGKMSNEEVLRAAQESEILSKVVDQEETRLYLEQLTATRQKNADLSQAILKEENPKTKEALINEQIETLKVLSSSAADIGRKLQAHNITVKGDESQITQQIINRILKNNKNVDGLAERLSQVDFTNQKEVNDVYREFFQPTIGEILDEFRYNNMLSNPRTQLRNIYSNTFQALITQPLTKFAEASVDYVASIFTGKQTKAKFGEVPTYVEHMVKSFPEAYKKAIDVLKERERIENRDLETMIPTGKMKKFFRLPTLAMEAGDRFFQTLISSGEEAALIKNRKLSPSEAKKLSKETAKYSIFRSGLDTSNKTGQGVLLSSIDKAIQGFDDLLLSLPGKSGKWIVPFIRTPMNFAKQWLEYSPAGLFTTIGSTNKKAQIGKSMLGSVAMALGAMAAAGGNTTWSVPEDPEEKELFYASGKKPYAIKVGDKWVPMMYMGPFALAVAIPAAVKYYNVDQREALTSSGIEKVGKGIVSSLEFFSQQTFLESFSNFLNLLTGKDNANIENTLAFTGGQVIPWQGLVRYVSTIIDPTFRKADSFIDELKRNTPFLSESLDPYREPSGVESTRNIFSYVAPFDISQEKSEYDAMLKFRQEILRNNKVLSEMDSKIKEEAMKILDVVSTEKDEEKIVNELKKMANNEQLKSAFKSIIKKQATYQMALSEPLKYLDQKDIAEILFGRMIMAETEEDTAGIQNFINQLKDIGRWNGEEKTKIMQHLRNFMLDMKSAEIQTIGEEKE